MLIEFTFTKERSGILIMTKNLEQIERDTYLFYKTNKFSLEGLEQIMKEKEQMKRVIDAEMHGLSKAISDAIDDLGK